MLFTGSNSIIIYLPQPLDGAPSLFSISLMFFTQVALPVLMRVLNCWWLLSWPICAIYKHCKAFAHHHDLKDAVIVSITGDIRKCLRQQWLREDSLSDSSCENKVFLLLKFKQMFKTCRVQKSYHKHLNMTCGFIGRD